MKHTIQKEKEKNIKNLVKISMTRITIEKRRQGFPLTEVKNLFEIICLRKYSPTCDRFIETSQLCKFVNQMMIDIKMQFENQK